MFCTFFFLEPNIIYHYMFGEMISLRKHRSKEDAVKITAVIISLTAFILLTVIFTSLTKKIQPQIISICENDAKRNASALISQILSEELKDGEFSYESLVNLNYSEDGTVTSVTHNAGQINRLIAEVTQNLNKKLAKSSVFSTQIPIGTLLNSPYLNGKGFRITIKTRQSGSAEVNVSSMFTSGGINQTLHKIILEINVLVNCISPPYSTEVSYSQQYIIAETLIIGEIPQGHIMLK